MFLTPPDREWIEGRARAAGFDLSGVAEVAAEKSKEAVDENRRFSAWVKAGHAGEMEYMKRADHAGNLVRGDVRRAIPWARSVIVCAVNYSASAPLSIDAAEAGAGWIGRYVWSGKAAADGDARSDYHDVLLPKLKLVEADLKQRYPECETKCYVDTGPILERGYAVRAGVGWIGKNTCVIHQQEGSWLLLGVIVTSLAIQPDALSVTAADRCGSCTRCIDACPTDALIDPGESGVRSMDASRCIAYLTIEKDGSIAEELRAPMGRQVFGCDICQDVCPWNRKAAIAASGSLPVRQDLINPSLDWLASLEGTEFTRVFRGTPVERTRRQTSHRKFFRRNVAIAMGNSGDAKFLPQLDAWSGGQEPVLAEAAAWAAASLRAAEK